LRPAMHIGSGEVPFLLSPRFPYAAPIDPAL
jgi:hypothetical protein